MNTKEALDEVVTHLLKDRRTWIGLMADAKTTLIKTAFVNKVYQVAKEEAESDEKLILKLREVVE
jgi:hypothetical protein